MNLSLLPAIVDKPYRDLTGQIKDSNNLAGYGGMSDVHRGTWTNPDTGQPTIIAIKLLRFKPDDPKDLAKMTERLYREIRGWSQREDLNVLPFLGISNDAGGEGHSPALISPFCARGEVMEYLIREPDADRLEIVKGVAKGLRYLHSINIIHGDIKGRNVLIGEGGEPLLCDFGRSRIIDHQGFTSCVLGTIGYMAPELLGAVEEANEDVDTDDEEGSTDDAYKAQEIYNDKLTTKTDVYAYAMVAVEIFTGNPPYYYIKPETRKAIHIVLGKQLKRRKYRSQTLTDARWDLLAECWCKDPMERPEVYLILPRLV